MRSLCVALLPLLLGSATRQAVANNNNACAECEARQARGENIACTSLCAKGDDDKPLLRSEGGKKDEHSCHHGAGGYEWCEAKQKCLRPWEEKCANEEEEQEAISKKGGKKDEHGCFLGAGYEWCEAKQKCLRPWEEKCPPKEDEEEQVPTAGSFVAKSNACAEDCAGL